MNEDQEDRRRIVSALAAHTFNKMAEGDEVRVYDISTDSFWFVGRKNGRMAWRPDEPSNLITIAMVRRELERMAGESLRIGSRDGTAWKATLPNGYEVAWVMPKSALSLSLDDMERLYLRAVADEIRYWGVVRG